MRLNVKFWKWLIHYQGRLHAYKIIPGLIGMQSRTNDNNHVLFLDFDGTTLQNVEKKCASIQREYSLGDMHIFRSSKRSYHTICLDKLTFGECADIDIELGMNKYLRFAALRGFWVLRINEKPGQGHIRLLMTLTGNQARTTSRPHYQLLKYLYPGLPVPANLDNHKKIYIDNYTSVNK